ncbi:hypothetical protein [Mycobacteroides abscessus]|uniref:hypothetical protein n=1 Tax=Mycobacteroides abscessus TaxID=36809 RepID=UPI001896691E
MGSKLEPTEAQRKALVDKLGEHVQWHRDGVELAVDEMIAAANSIPEGAPVGTIARRPPDGARIADGMPQPGDADSWPVIYDPTGKTLDELHAEIDRLDKAEDSALRERDYWEETVNRILYTCSSVNEIGEWSSANDPVERFIEQFKPVKRIDPTKPDFSRLNGTDKGAVGFITGLSDDRLEELGGFPDPTAQQEPSVYELDRLAMESIRTTAAQQEPAYTVAAASEEMAKYWDNSIVTTTKREPRVLPSLDCEEARDGTVWADNHGEWRYWFENEDWRTDEGVRGKNHHLYNPGCLTVHSFYTEVLDVG